MENVILEDSAVERIKLEIELRQRLLEQLEPKPKGSRIFKALNTPFVITVLGGIAISYIGSSYQSRLESTERKTSQQAALSARKLELASNAVNDLESSVMILGRRRIMSLALTNPKERDSMGMSAKDVVDENRRLWWRYANSNKPNAILSQIKAHFTSASVEKYAAEFDKVVTALQRATDKTQVFTEAEKCRNELELLSSAMIEEVSADSTT